MGNGIETWTIERVEVLKSLRALGYSCGRIAKELDCGISRNAVIGKLARLDVSGETVRPKPLKPKVTVRSKQARFYHFEAEPVRVADELPPDQSEFVCMILDLNQNQCRYPIGDPAGLNTFRYCGAPKEHESYCGRHHRLTRHKIEPSKRTICRPFRDG